MNRACLGVLVAIAACGAPGKQAPAVSGELFVERAGETGLDFTHVNGMSGKRHIAEVIGAGVALFDYDNDGDLDVYLVQSGSLDAAAARSPQHSDRLYRNDLAIVASGERMLRFTDATPPGGIGASGYGMGVAAGDVDNDGWIDLYLTKFNSADQLLRNDGRGGFRDVSRSSGLAQRSWSVSASFVDINRDGWLDLYVGRYLRYSLSQAAPCFSPAGILDYCTPEAYEALPDTLYLNRGDGTFQDVSVRSGITAQFGPALGVATADFNGDGWMDIYVANDGKENQLWVNRRDGTFQNTALLSGVALPITAKAEGSMGVDAGDFDNDGDDDLVMTELTGEGSNLFVNDGTGVFEDRSAPAGVGPLSMRFTGFGAAWLDFDNDGLLDLLSVNGAVQIIEPLRQAGDPFPLHQRKVLFRNSGGGRFEDVTDKAGVAFSLSEVGRGAAFGDVDNDGDTDVLVGNNNGRVRLLLNQSPRKHWVGLRLLGPGGRDMVGARVEVRRPGTASVWRRARSDGSYASANDPRVLVGLGDSSVAPEVRVIWPSGREETWAVEIDRYTTLTEGTRLPAEVRSTKGG